MEPKGWKGVHMWRVKRPKAAARRTKRPGISLAALFHGVYRQFSFFMRGYVGEERRYLPLARASVEGSGAKGFQEQSRNPRIGHLFPLPLAVGGPAGIKGAA